MSKRPLTVKQRKLIKARVEGKTLRESAQEAGYSGPESAHRALKTGNANAAMIAALERRGITDDKIAAKVDELMDATKLVGKNADVVAPDNAARLGAVSEANKIKGVYAPTKQEITGKDGKPLALAKPMSVKDLAAAALEIQRATRK